VVPIVIQAPALQGPCDIPDNSEPGDTCPLWYSNNDLGTADFAPANLSQWGIVSDAVCSNSGSVDRRDWLLYGYPDLLRIRSDGPTYLCVDTGESSATFEDIVDRMNSASVTLFPVNNCDTQVDENGNPVPCSETPDKFGIVAIEALRIIAVYKADDPVAIGTPPNGGDPGVPGVCGIRSVDPNAVCMVVEVTPYPDARISSDPDGGFIGGGLQNLTGDGQAAELKLAPGGTKFVPIRVRNDGSVVDDLTLRGPSSDDGLRVEYFSAGAEITRRVVNGTFLFHDVAPGVHRGLRVRLHARTDSCPEDRSVRVRTRAVSDPTIGDAVRADVSLVC
jgi:hypothetical protein